MALDVRDYERLTTGGGGLEFRTQGGKKLPCQVGCLLWKRGRRAGKTNQSQVREDNAISSLDLGG